MNSEKCFFPISRYLKWVIRSLLYFIWKGSYQTVNNIEKVQPELGLLCLSTYKALLPIVHLIRLGYNADAVVLLRAVMERIALLGYLNNNRDIIQKYKEGKSNLQEDAMHWAKKNSLENWMHLYGMLSKVAHSGKEGVAGHIFEDNEIGEAYRCMLPQIDSKHASTTEELLALVSYVLLAVNPIAADILSSEQLQRFLDDIDAIKFISVHDMLGFHKFIERFVDKYTKDNH